MNSLGNSRLRSYNFEKSPKKLPKTFFLSADTYSDYGVSPIAEGVEFLPFFGLGRRKNNDILGIYFVRNNCVFSDALEPVQNKIPKKNTFLGNFPGCIFHYVSLFVVMFLHCAFWVVHDVRLGGRKSVRKNAIFSRLKNDVFSASEKMTFFRVRQYGAFWLQRSHTISLRQQA